MFAKPRAKPVVAPPRKKRKITSAIEEIAFDPSAREEYLSGFHKRKLQRIKHAKEEAAKRDREEKLTARKILREGRKADLEKHVEAVNSLLREQAGVISDPSDEETADVEQWEGITEEPAIDHENEYVDDDRFTTVTVEAVDVTKDGLHKSRQEDEDESDGLGADNADGETGGKTAGRQRAGPETAKRTWTKEPPIKAKKKKPKFRYESKAERKVTRHKERSGNRVKAKARKE